MKDRWKVDNPTLTRTKNVHPTIGVLNITLDGPVPRLQWLGVVDAAQKHGINVVYFLGDALCIPDGFLAQANILYDLVDVERIDGLVVFAESLGSYVDPGEIESFIRQFHPLPIVSVEKAFVGIPTILMDNYRVMREMMVHLIEEHGYRRIAFIRGPVHHVGLQERYRAYTETLSEYGLPVDPRLITPPVSWMETKPMITMLLDERQLSPQTDFEAVVAAWDTQARATIRELQARGVRVPDEVAVTGFDDNEKSQYITPPLTTVRPSFYEMGAHAIEMLVDILAGEEVPEQVIVPIKLVIRQSCGCPSQTIVQVATEPVAGTGESLQTALATRREMILTEMAQMVEIHGNASPHVVQIVDAFVLDIENASSDKFLRILDDVLRQIIATDEDSSTGSGQTMTGWQNALSTLRRYVLPWCDDHKTLLRAENLWQQARVLIGETAERLRASQRFQAEYRDRRLRKIETALITTFDVENLLDVLTERLPQLGIPGCYLVLYEDPQPYQYPQSAPQWSRLVLAYNEQGRITLETDGQRFRSRHLVPEGLLPQHHAYSLIVEPLYFRNQQMGFMLFEIGPRDGKVYGALREEISSALQGALLVKELSQYRERLEDLVEARTAELNQLTEVLQQEIAEHREAERSLRISEQQYRLLAQSMRDGAVIVQDGKLVFVNAAFAAMVGKPQEHLLMLDPVTVFHDTAKSTVQAQLASRSNKPPEAQWQAELVTRDGQTLWIEIEQTSIVWNSRSALLLTIRNIHERKLRELHLEEERTRLHQENVTLKSSIKDRYKFGDLVGKSPPMQYVYELIMNAAASDVSVLVCGESGTGKELVARTIHQMSARKKHPFVPVNCASIPDTLFEREFFGHRKGTFTGADRDHPGFFDRAHQGLLFLDEVTELSPGAQAKLLRVLQDGEYTPLGSNTTKQADAVIIAATNRDCQTDIEQGRLRQDFFYRICVIEITLPPLRKRKEDLSLLIEHILDRYRQKQQRLHGRELTDLPTDPTMLPSEFVQALYAYHWPGNVRELQNVLQRYLATNDLSSVLTMVSTSRKPQTMSESRTRVSTDMKLPEAVHAFEKQMIADMLARNRYRIGKTAEMLGVPLRTLQRKIKHYRLREPDEL